MTTKLTASEKELVNELIQIGRRCVSQALALASGGNLSARLPGSDRYLITGSGEWLDELTPKSFSIMTVEGERIGGAQRPSSEWKLHQRTYQARSDVNGIVHVHPQHAVLIEAIKKPMRFLTLDHALYVGSVGSVPFYPNGSDELANEAATQAETHNAVILAHHGSSTVGDDIHMAFRRAMLLEEAATMTYRLLMLGDETTDFPPDAVKTVSHA